MIFEDFVFLLEVGEEGGEFCCLGLLLGGLVGYEGLEGLEVRGVGLF